jgi:hypothetical protein
MPAEDALTRQVAAAPFSMLLKSSNVAQMRPSSGFFAGKLHAVEVCILVALFVTQWLAGVPFSPSKSSM